MIGYQLELSNELHEALYDHIRSKKRLTAAQREAIVEALTNAEAVP